MDEPQVIEVDLGPGVRAFFTTTHGGLSSGPYASLNLGLATGDDPAVVRENRRRVEAAARMPVTFATQVHGTEVSVLVGPQRAQDSCGEFDALVTRERGSALGVLVADCVPVLLADPRAGVVGAVHAGRRGLADGVLDRAVDRLTDLGARDVCAVIGPAACGRCYEVPAELRAAVAGVLADAWSETSWGTPALDLPAAAATRLRERGVEVAQVERCTIEDPALFSYRRAAGEPTGRSAAIVGLV